eukprot:240187-Chlamydomonas_euryale.AAC.3
MAPELSNARALAVACEELRNLAQFKAPRDKLVCVLNCCTVINTLLASRAHGTGGQRRRGGKGAGAEGMCAGAAGVASLGVVVW